MSTEDIKIKEECTKRIVAYMDKHEYSPVRRIKILGNAWTVVLKDGDFNPDIDRVYGTDAEGKFIKDDIVTVILEPTPQGIRVLSNRANVQSQMVALTDSIDADVVSLEKCIYTWA